MRKVALRGLVAHKLRLLLTLVAVGLGVAFMSGVLMLTDTMNSSFDDLFTTAYEGTDAVVRSEESFDGEFGETQRGTVDESLVEEIAALPEVAAVEGDVFNFAQVITEDGDPYGAGAFGPPSYGGAWPTDDTLNPFEIREGRSPEGPGEIVLDAATARGTGYEVGDTVPVETRGGVQDFTLVGVAGFGNVDSPAGATYILFTVEEAQELVGEPGRLDAVLVAAAGDVSQDELVDEIRTSVNGAAGLEVLSGEDVTEEEQSNIQEGLSFITIFFLVFAVVAVVVGGFVIYNSFSMIVAQRTREMALLRALGASRRQVRRSVFLEAIGVGLVGAVVGFVLGLAIAAGLTALMGIEGSLVIGVTSVVVALVSGVLVTLASSLVPAWRASRVPPLAAMRDVAIDRSGRSKVRFGIGLALMALGVVLVVANALAGAVALVGVGVAAAFVGLLVAGPGLAGPVSAALGWPIGRFRGVTGALARRNVGRNPGRSASTAYALTIGVGIVAFFLVINASIRSSVDKVLDENFTGDFIVSSGNFGTLGLPPEVAEDVEALPEVEGVAPLRFTPVQVDGDTAQVTGTSGAAFDIFGLDLAEGSAELAPGEVVLLDDKADSEGLELGDTVTLDFLDSEPATVTVAGVYEAVPGNELGSYIIGLEEYDRHVSDVTDSQVMVELAPGTSPDEARQELDRVVAGFPSAEVQTVEDLKDSFAAQLDSMLMMVMALLAIAIIIALFGIINTMALSVFERTRELGLLRAVGATRGQVRSAVRWESVIVALLGTILGLGVGVLGGWGMVTALGDEGFDVFTLPVAYLVVVMLVAAVVGVLAGLYPAWRAGHLNVLRAIHTE